MTPAATLTAALLDVPWRSTRPPQLAYNWARAMTKDADERERATLARARGGDRAALAELYRAHAPSLYRRVLLPALGEPSAAEDALAETFRAAFAKLDQFELRPGGLYPWLARIAKNKATDMHRKRARQARALGRFEALLPPRESAEQPFDEVAGREEARLLRARVARILAKLNPRYRRAIELRFFEERERDACARELDVKLGTFDVVLLRSLRAFRREWERMDWEATPPDDTMRGPA